MPKYEQLEFEYDPPVARTKHKAFYYRYQNYYCEVEDNFEDAKAFLDMGEDYGDLSASHIEDWYGNVVWGTPPDKRRKANVY